MKRALLEERNTKGRATSTEWFYNPLKGQPRYVDIYGLRAIAGRSEIFKQTSAIIAQVAGMSWSVNAVGRKVSKRKLQYAKKLLEHPSPGDTWRSMISAAVRDSLELDAFCLVKGFSNDSYVKEKSGAYKLKPLGKRKLLTLFARDGGSFLRETDINGISYRYWQYSYLHPAVAPSEFDVHEVAYGMRHPRSYSLYGHSELEVLKVRDRLRRLFHRAPQIYAAETLSQVLQLIEEIMSLNILQEIDPHLMFSFDHGERKL